MIINIVNYMVFNMTAISINIPEALAQASQEAAQQLGISRNQFIRLAIAHELKQLRAQQEQQAMAKAFKIMESSPDYLTESQEIDKNLNTILPDEDEENWWKK